VQGPSLFSPYVGEAEKRVTALFRQARACAPCIIFIDELDAIAGNSRFGEDGSAAGGGGRGDGEDGGVGKRVVSELLHQLDGVAESGPGAGGGGGGGSSADFADGFGTGVLLLACTSDIKSIDPALLRPGRLDHHLHVPVPSAADRLAILRLASARMPLGPDVKLDGLAAGTSASRGEDGEAAAETGDGDRRRGGAPTKGFTCAQLHALCREAALQCARESMSQPADEHAASTPERIEEVPERLKEVPLVVTDRHFSDAIQALRSVSRRNLGEEV
jgi:SpoVK/Ycf46/Vps4 family AAA+-type ATPase